MNNILKSAITFVLISIGLLCVSYKQIYITDFSPNSVLVNRMTTSDKSCDTVLKKLTRSTHLAVIFNSACFYQRFHHEFLALEWNPTEIDLLLSDSLQFHFISTGLVKNASQWDRQYVGGLDSSGNKIIITRYINFNENSSFLKDYFYSKFIYVYDNDNEIVTTIFDLSQRRLIKYYY